MLPIIAEVYWQYLFRKQIAYDESSTYEVPIVVCTEYWSWARLPNVTASKSKDNNEGAQALHFLRLRCLPKVRSETSTHPYSLLSVGMYTDYICCCHQPAPTVMENYHRACLSAAGRQAAYSTKAASWHVGSLGSIIFDIFSCASIT